MVEKTPNLTVTKEGYLNLKPHESGKWKIDLQDENVKLFLANIGYKNDDSKSYLLNDNEFIRSLIKAFSKMLLHKVRLRKIDNKIDAVLSGKSIVDHAYSNLHQNLFEVIVDFISFHMRYGELFVWKTISIKEYSEEPDIFDIDSLFDDPIYLEYHTVIPNLHKTTVKILTTGEELLGLYSYILKSIVKYFDIDLTLTDIIDQYAFNFQYQYNLPQNLFEPSYMFDEIVSQLQEVLIRIHRSTYIKDPEYHLLYDLLSNFLECISGGISLPFYDLWEYMCLSHYISNLGQDKLLLYFDLEDKLYHHKDLKTISLQEISENIFKLSINGPLKTMISLRPDLVIGEFDENGQLKKIKILDMKFKEKISTEDKVKMDFYRVCIGAGMKAKDIEIECSFVLPSKDQNSYRTEEYIIVHKNFGELLKEFISEDKINDLITQIETDQYKRIFSESTWQSKGSTSQTDIYECLLQILCLLKDNHMYKIEKNAIIKITLNIKDIKEKQDSDSIHSKSCLSSDLKEVLEKIKERRVRDDIYNDIYNVLNRCLSLIYSCLYFFSTKTILLINEKPAIEVQVDS